MSLIYIFFLFFFFNDTATTEIYTLSLHDALPLWPGNVGLVQVAIATPLKASYGVAYAHGVRSEEHTSEFQSRLHLVCRLLLEKKKKTLKNAQITRTQSTTSKQKT